MSDSKIILELENEIKARLLESVLRGREIPHYIRSYHDSAYAGLFQLHRGWGHVIAPEVFEDEIKQIATDLKVGFDLKVSFDLEVGIDLQAN